MSHVKKTSPLRHGTRYRAHRLNGPYDAIVIGSGVGGLTSAACLARMGQKVLVLEQHYSAGGFNQCFERHGYAWDVGVHCVGEVGHPSSLAHKVSHFISEGRLHWAALHENYDTFIINNESFGLIAGSQGFIDSVSRHFPAERAAITTYVELICQAAELVRQQHMADLMPWPISTCLKHKSQKHPLLHKTTYAVLRELTDNEKLIAVLTGQWGDLGVPPQESAFVMHAQVAKHYLNGGYYPVGGSASIAGSIIPTIENAGGDVFTYAKVEKILVSGNSAVGVEMADGQCIYAPKIISNTGIFNTLKKLLAADVVLPTVSLSHLNESRPAMGNMSLYIGLNKDARSLHLPKTNYWIYPNEHFQQNVEKFRNNASAEFPLVYISFPSAKDPLWHEKHPGCATIEMTVPVPLSWFERWQDKPWGHQEDEFVAFKAGFSKRLIELLLKRMPHLAEHIDYYELSTPLCRQGDKSLSDMQHAAQVANRFVATQVPLKNLYLTGQDMASGGIVDSMLAGVRCASQAGGYSQMKMLRSIIPSLKKTSKNILSVVAG